MKLYDISCLDHYESFNVIGSDFELLNKYEGIELIKEEWGIKELKRSYRGEKGEGTDEKVSRWIDNIENSVPNRNIVETIMGVGDDATAEEIVEKLYEANVICL